MQLFHDNLTYQAYYYCNVITVIKIFLFVAYLLPQQYYSHGLVSHVPTTGPVHIACQKWYTVLCISVIHRQTKHMGGNYAFRFHSCYDVSNISTPSISLRNVHLHYSWTSWATAFLCGCMLLLLFLLLVIVIIVIIIVSYCYCYYCYLLLLLLVIFIIFVIIISYCYCYYFYYY